MVSPKASALNHERSGKRHLDLEREEHKGDGGSFLADNLSCDSRAMKVASVANASYPTLISFIGFHAGFQLLLIVGSCVSE
jgi:hypothetical protein